MKEVKIGQQLWTAENLNEDTFANGDLIYEITSKEQWYEFIDSKKPGWCYYDFDTENAKYGKIYNIYAVIDERGLAPEGWLIPSNADWDLLVETIGENNASSLKNSSGWWMNENGTNESGFSGLPGGYMDDGEFYYKDFFANWWSMEVATNFKGSLLFDNEPQPLYVYAESHSGDETCNQIHRGTNSEYSIAACGYYVRCMKG